MQRGFGSPEDYISLFLIKMDNVTWKEEKKYCIQKLLTCQLLYSNLHFNSTFCSTMDAADVWKHGYSQTISLLVRYYM